MRSRKCNNLCIFFLNLAKKYINFLILKFMADNLYGKDKLKHLLACFVIALYNTEAAILSALTKEYADVHSKGNHWCWWDLLADFIGTILGTIVRLLLIKWIYGYWKWNWI
jgi:hypothetical protein